jgi:hypothetical protein
MPRRVIKKRRSSELARYYIDHEEYTNELVKYKKSGEASDRLAEMWKLHVDRCATAECFKGYTYIDDMKGTALLHLIQYSKSFDADKVLDSGLKPNAFKYCTTMIHNAFLQVINKEKVHSKLKDKLVKAHQRIIHNINNYQITYQQSLDD